MTTIVFYLFFKRVEKQKFATCITQFAVNSHAHRNFIVEGDLLVYIKHACTHTNHWLSVLILSNRSNHQSIIWRTHARLNTHQEANAVHVRRLLTGQLIYTVANASRVTYMLYAPGQSTLFITGHIDGQVHVWNIQSDAGRV
jgi:hypothetical protein